MDELFEKSLKKLELDKILELLAEQAACPAAKERCRVTVPLTDADEIRTLQDLPERGTWARRWRARSAAAF